jgi:hypothetical protein
VGLSGLGAFAAANSCTDFNNIIASFPPGTDFSHFFATLPQVMSGDNGCLPLCSSLATAAAASLPSTAPCTADLSQLLSGIDMSQFPPGTDFTQFNAMVNAFKSNGGDASQFGLDATSGKTNR